MQLPFTPATDNLYKFTALGGLVLIVVSCFYPVSKLQEANEKSIGLATSARLLHISEERLAGDIAELRADTSELNRQLDTADNAPPPPTTAAAAIVRPTSRSTAAPTTAQVELFRAKAIASASRLKSIEQSRYELEGGGAKLEADVAIESMTNRARLAWWLMLVTGNVAGLTLTIYGFRHWATFQRQQDELLRYQVEEARRKANPAEAPRSQPT